MPSETASLAERQRYQLPYYLPGKKPLTTIVKGYLLIVFPAMFLLFPLCIKIQEDFLWIFMKYRPGKRALVQLPALGRQTNFTVSDQKNRNIFFMNCRTTLYSTQLSLKGNSFVRHGFSTKNDKELTPICFDIRNPQNLRVSSYKQENSRGWLELGTKFAYKFSGKNFALSINAQRRNTENNRPVTIDKCISVYLAETGPRPHGRSRYKC